MHVQVAQNIIFTKLWYLLKFCRQDLKEIMQVCRLHRIFSDFFFVAKLKNESDENLSAGSGGDSKKKISDILRKFMSRRPSSDTLRQKGILKGMLTIDLPLP